MTPPSLNVASSRVSESLGFSLKVILGKFVQVDPDSDIGSIRNGNTGSSGLYVNNSVVSLNFNNVLLKDFRSTGDGGAIYFDVTSEVGNFKNVVFENCIASSGGAIYCRDKCILKPEEKGDDANAEPKPESPEGGEEAQNVANDLLGANQIKGFFYIIIMI